MLSLCYLGTISSIGGLLHILQFISDDLNIVLLLML